MTATLPHPTRTGAEALYVIDGTVPQDWFAEYRDLRAAEHGDPMIELDTLLWRLLDRLHAIPARDVRRKLERALVLVDRIERHHDEQHRAMANAYWSSEAA